MSRRILMSNHLHLIISKNKKTFTLSDIVRDFKKYTASSIIKLVEESSQESRRNWMLWLFRSAGEKNRNNAKYQFWKQDSHAEQLISNKFMDQKLDYLHNNPVSAHIVDYPADYLYSSARDYSGKKGLLAIEMIA